MKNLFHLATYLLGMQLTSGVDQHFLGYAMHCTYTGCRGDDLNVYLAYKMTCGGHSINAKTGQHFILHRRVWYRFLVSRGIKDFSGLGGTSVPGTLCQVHGTADTLFDCAPRALYLRFAFIFFSLLDGGCLHIRECDCLFSARHVWWFRQKV